MAARISGVSTWKIIWKHLVPGFMSYLIVSLTLGIPVILLNSLYAIEFSMLCLFCGVILYFLAALRDLSAELMLLYDMSNHIKDPRKQNHTYSQQ